MLIPIEFHHFSIKGRWFLYNVNTLVVLPSFPWEGTMLKLVGTGLGLEEAAQQMATVETLPMDVFMARLDILVNQKFLIPVGEKQEIPPVAAASGYATFMINVAQRCNLTCPYCYVNKGLFDYEEKPIKRMSHETAAQVIEAIHSSFPEFNTYGYHFYGGEPLLNFDVIRELVELAEKKAKFTQTYTDYHITTNGTLLNKEIADFMDEHRFTVYFSIDGDQERHDELRKYTNGKGSFEDVKSNLEYLRTRKGVHLIGSSVIRKGLSLEDAIQMLADHGSVQCKAERVRLKEEDSLALDGLYHDDYLHDIEELAEHYIGSLSNGQKPMDFRLSSKILQLVTRKRRTFFCPAGSHMFGVASNGELYPCALHVGRSQSILGNIEVGIDKEKQQTFREKFSVAGQKDCQNCWTRHLCGGGCSAMVDRFGHEDCNALRKESETAIAVFQHFTETDPIQLLSLVSPKVVQWVNGELEDENEIALTEPAGQKMIRN